MSALPVVPIGVPAASVVAVRPPALAVSALAVAGREGPPSSTSRSPPTAQRFISTSLVEGVVGASVALVTLACLFLYLGPPGALTGDPAGVPTRTSLASSKAAVAVELVSTFLVAAVAARSSSVLSATSLSRAQSWPTEGAYLRRSRYR